MKRSILQDNCRIFHIYRRNYNKYPCRHTMIMIKNLFDFLTFTSPAKFSERNNILKKREKPNGIHLPQISVSHNRHSDPYIFIMLEIGEIILCK